MIGAVPVTPRSFPFDNSDAPQPSPSSIAAGSKTSARGMRYRRRLSEAEERQRECERFDTAIRAIGGYAGK